VKAEQASSGQPSFGSLAHWMADRWNDATISDEELSELSSEFAGRVVEVATYSDPFELRKVHFIWSAQDAAVAAEDARVITFHLAKVSGGSVTADWLAADFTALDAAFSTWWTTMKAECCNSLTWDRLKVYKAGPAIVPPQLPVYDADKNVPGTDAGFPLPPQVAVTVTEIAGSKRHWGRFYFPPVRGGNLGNYGRVKSEFQTILADATDTLYTTLKSAGLEPVVYRPALPARETRGGATLPARGATAWTVEKLQVDDVFDVIRSRRFKYPTLRVQRDI